MEYYNDEEIIGELYCRIDTYDKTIPDCMCALVMTTENVYAIEDNYDGTYTEHIKIAMKNVNDIVIDKPFADTLGKYHIFRRGRSAYDGVAYGDSEIGKAIVGSLDQSKKQKQQEEQERMSGNNGNKNKKFFLIDYNNEKGQKDKVYFDDFSMLDAKYFIKKYNKYFK